MGPDRESPAHADVTTFTIDAHGHADPRARDTRPVVLVVDDEESYREALASGLAQEGFATELKLARPNGTTVPAHCLGSGEV